MQTKSYNSIELKINPVFADLEVGVSGRAFSHMKDFELETGVKQTKFKSNKKFRYFINIKYLIFPIFTIFIRNSSFIAQHKPYFCCLKTQTVSQDKFLFILYILVKQEICIQFIFLIQIHSLSKNLRIYKILTEKLINLQNLVCFILRNLNSFIININEFI